MNEYSIHNFQHYYVPFKRKENGEPDDDDELPFHAHALIVPREREEVFRKINVKKWKPWRFIFESDLTAEQMRLYAKSPECMRHVPAPLTEIDAAYLKLWMPPVNNTGKYGYEDVRLRFTFIIPKHLEREFLDSKKEDNSNPSHTYIFESKLCEEDKARAKPPSKAELDKYLARYDPVYHQQILEKYGLEEKVTVKRVTTEVVESKDKKDYENITEDYENETEDYVKENKQPGTDGRYHRNGSPETLTRNMKNLGIPSTQNAGISTSSGGGPSRYSGNLAIPSAEKVGSSNCDSRGGLNNYADQVPAERYSRNDAPISPNIMPREPYNVSSFQHYFVPSRKKKVGEPENSEEFPVYIHARIVPKGLEKEFRKWGTKREDLEIVYESQLTEQQIQRYAISSYDIGFLPRCLLTIYERFLKTWIDPNFMAWKAPCILLDCRHYVIPEHLEKEFRDLGMEDYGKTKYLFETKLSEEMKANTYFRPDIDEALAYYDPVYHQQIIDKYGLEEVVTVKAVTPEVVESNDKKDYENKTEDYEIGTEDHVKEDNVYEETSDDEYEENISASPDAGNRTYSDGFGDMTWQPRNHNGRNNKEEASNDGPTSLNDSVLTDHNKWLANRKNYRSNPDWASHFQEKPQTRNDGRYNRNDSSEMLTRNMSNLEIPSTQNAGISTSSGRGPSRYSGNLAIQSAGKVGSSNCDSRGSSSRYTDQGPAERYSRNDFPMSPRHGTSSQQSDHTGFRGTQRFPILHERPYNQPTTVQNASEYNRNYSSERLSSNIRNSGISSSQEVGYSTYSRGGSSRYTDQSPDEGYCRNDLLRQGTSSHQNDYPRFRETQRFPILHDQGPAERHRHDLLRQETSSHQNDYPGYSGRQRYPNSYDQGAGERHRRLDPLLIPLRNPPEIRDEDWETPVLSHIRRGPEAEDYVKIARRGTTRQFKEIDLDF